MNLSMTCLQVVGLKADLQVAVQTLRVLGCVHLDSLNEIPEISARPLVLSAEALRNQEEVSALLAHIEGLIEALGGVQPASGVRPAADDIGDLDAARIAVATLAPQVQELIARRDKHKADLDLLPRYEATLRNLIPIIPDSAHAPGNVLVGLLVSRAHLEVFDLVSRHVLELTGGRTEIALGDTDASTRAMLLVFPSEYADKIESLLGREDISRLRLPAELGDSSPDAALVALRRRLAAIPAEITAIERELNDLAEVWTQRLAHWRKLLQEELVSYGALACFGETETAFAVVGWVPTQEAARVKAAFEQALGERVLVQELPLTHQLKQRAPIALKNPPLAQPFEGLVSLLALPSYGSIDPTSLMALFLPLFFGMMLGDVGYGLLLLGISLALRTRFKKGFMRSMMAVLAMGSAWAIVFGFLFGELFGNLGEKLGMHALWMDRAKPEQLTGLLLMTIAIGAVHVTLGLVLGVWEAVREKSRNHLLERGGMLLGLISLFLIVGELANVLPKGTMAPATAAMIVGIVLLGLPMGWLGLFIGPIEFIGLLGNVLSYMRIAAIGLASVYLAKVANDMAGMVGNVIVGVIIAVLIHALNLVMGAFSPTIHSLRLHYVEFFRKFYEGGGRPYTPFGSQLGPE